ncbi:MAG: nuclear transport factor 2 family protein [Pseudomonadota bacterium]
MTNALRLVFLAASLLGSVAIHAAERVDRAVSPEHRAALDAYRTAMVRAYLDAKPDSIVRPLSETVRLLPAYQQTILGKADAATYYRAFVKRFAVSAYDRQPIEVADIGQRVIEMGRFTMTVAVRGSAETHALAGKYMDLWEKSAAGKLELNTAAWNHDEYPKIAEQLRFTEVPAVHMALQARVPVAAGISLELAAIQKLQESTIIQHDGKTWALFYADDAILLANHGGVVSGRKALDEYTVAHANAFPVFEKLDLRTHRIDDLREYVIEYASGVVNWRVGESSGVSLGKNILVWRRDSGGTLKIWRAISMYD